MEQGWIHGNPIADSWAGAVMRKPLGIQQGRIHGNPVADDWAGAVMRKPLEIQQYDGPTDRPKRQGVESRVRD